MGIIRFDLYPHRTGGEDILNLAKVKYSLVEDVSSIYTPVLGGRLIFKGGFSHGYKCNSYLCSRRKNPRHD